MRRSETSPEAESDPATEPSSLPLFLSVDEAAELLRLNRKTLYEAVKLGRVPGVVRVGRSIRIRRATLLTWGAGKGSSALSE